MAAISSTYKDPSDSFIWWIEGDRIAIATLTGDANTRETSRSSYKAVQLGTSTSYQADGSTSNLVTEPVDTTETSITVAYGDSTIANFPDEAEHAVVLFAARKYLQRLLSDNEDEWYQTR